MRGQGEDRLTPSQPLPAARHGAERRLLAAVEHATAEHGYPALTVEHVLQAAGVSRASFYQYFTCLDDCFWSAYREHAVRFVADIEAAIARGRGFGLAAVEALFDVAVSRPRVLCLLIHESLSAGPRGLLERDAVIAALAAPVRRERSLAPTVDLPAVALIGAILSFLSVRLADGPASPELRAEVLAWARHLLREGSETCWSQRLAPRSPAAPPPRENAPVEAATGGACARERILHATAEAVRLKGYRAMTVADITSIAQVSRRGFYIEFTGKAAAFMAAYEHGFQRLMARCSSEFFRATVWPERVWSAALAFTGFLVREPALAHIGFLECQALGREFAPRVLDTQLAFTLFLEEGFRQDREGRPPPRSCAELTAAAVFELAFHGTRWGGAQHLWRLQPLAVHVALAPFIGSQEAGRFVEGKLPSLGDLTRAVA